MIEIVAAIVLAEAAVLTVKLWRNESERKRRHRSTPPVIRQVWWK